MRISPVIMAANGHFGLQKQKSHQDVSFGKIEEENREKIIENLPDPDPIYIGQLDYNNGVMVKWGGENHPRGLIYADLIESHVDKSCEKESYLEMTKEHWGDNARLAKLHACLDNLQELKTFKKLMSAVCSINLYENPDGTSRKLTRANTEDEGDNRDAAMKAADLYGTLH
ncbi:MAG: hypothetical protein Q4F80_06125 [bacterium]|nr:hypothetical protein [bacterium]